MSEWMLHIDLVSAPADLTPNLGNGSHSIQFYISLALDMTKQSSHEQKSLVSDCGSSLTDKYCWSIVFTTFIALIFCYAAYEFFREKNEGQYLYFTNSNFSVHTQARLRHPVAYVVVAQTNSGACYTRNSCIAELHKLPGAFPDNFAIGGDGNVYEGTGWNFTSHSDFLSHCSIGISLISDGDATERQIQTVEELIKYGISLRIISKYYKLLPLDSKKRRLHELLKNRNNFSVYNLQDISCP